ncbi:MAG TPA: helix-turn-helix domain-containing protein [Candidatus Anammoximicrobium sp.]|nr:helix-turn-helix domain-containing protein [Candidatus Anammoximicrobium sp.]
MRNALGNTPTTVLSEWLSQATPDSEPAARIRRELDRRSQERDQQIRETEAARLLDVSPEMIRRIVSAGIIRPIRELGGEYRFSRREVERWARWTVLSQEGIADEQ